MSELAQVDVRHLNIALAHEKRMRRALKKTKEKAAKRVAAVEDKVLDVVRDARQKALDSIDVEVLAALLYLDKRLTPQEASRFAGVKLAVFSGKVMNLVWHARKKYGAFLAKETK